MAYSLGIIPDNNFLPSWPSRLKRAFSAAVFGCAENKHSNYRHPGLQSEQLLTKNGLPYTCTRMRVEKPKAVLYILGGLRSEAHDKEYLYNVAYAMEIEIVFAELPKLERNTEVNGLFERIDDVAESFLTDLPYSDEYKNLPSSLIGMSTGSYKIIDYLHQSDEQATHLLREFDCVKPFSTFSKAAFLSSLISSIVYPIHVRRQGDKPYGSSFFDRCHVVIKELQGDPVYFRDPNDSGYPPHNEILYMSQKIEGRRARLLSKPFPAIVARSNKVELIHGNRDGVADLQSAIDLGKHMGVPVTIMDKTYHSPFSLQRIEAILKHVQSPQNRPYQERASLSSVASEFMRMNAWDVPMLARMQSHAAAHKRQPISLGRLFGRRPI